MSCLIHLHIIYILLSFCNDAVIGQKAAFSSVEIDGVEEDGENDSNKKINLFGFNYYDFMPGDVNTSEEYDHAQLKDENENSEEHGKNIVILDTMDTRNYKAEIKAGNKADLLGTNPHYHQPVNYPDFSRRFVLQYPYIEKVKENKDEINTDELIPKLASPELVLAVAEKSAIFEAAAPKSHNDEIMRKDILRTGDYWNSVWKEDAAPSLLRTRHTNKLETVKAEIPPGTKLYDLVSKLKHLSPTLLYVLNDKNV